MVHTTFAGALVLFAVAAYGQDVRLTAEPKNVYLERSLHAQYLNFDIVIENVSSEELLLTGIELLAYNDRGAIARRDFVDGKSRASLELGSPRAIAPRQKQLIFNPFHTFEADIPLERLTYVFSFANGKGAAAKEFRSELTVVPIRYENKTDLILPLRGRILVWDGHDQQSHHRRLDYTKSVFGIPDKYRTNFQRFSYDFVIVDERGELSRTPMRTTAAWYSQDPKNNDQFFGFGAPVLATGSGRVIEMHDGEADDHKWDPKQLEERETAYAGNYIIIDHLNGEYSWFGHLKQGSTKVKVGEEVRQGQVIAALGASGSSLFPHLHYELRTSGGASKADGLPSYFNRIRRVGAKSGETLMRAHIDTGDIVESMHR
jgi:hypothetical protein